MGVKCGWKGCKCDATVIVCQGHFEAMRHTSTHGAAMYSKGCRCLSCTAAQAARWQKWFSKNRERRIQYCREYRRRKKAGKVGS